MMSVWPPRSFLPTPSARRATLHHQNKIAAGPYFYPRPPRGGRLEFFLADQRAEKFLPTPSARRATAIRPIGAHIEPISTHALREEGDPSASPARAYCIISTHALREEGDIDTFAHLLHSVEFLPTPSARRATPSELHVVRKIKHFYPRPPRGGRRSSRPSAHAAPPDFYPRPPRGGRPVGLPCARLLHNFYPRPPRGGRLDISPNAITNWKFLPTPSARRATRYQIDFRAVLDISTHALREEGDAG